MRLWSLHPRYLDTKGLLAVWREGLLAQKVLEGKTRGYTNHPQLSRFRAHASPLEAIGCYLTGIHEESLIRGYSFAAEKIIHPVQVSAIPVTTGQISFERSHLLEKLANRDIHRHDRLKAVSDTKLQLHPLFSSVSGDVEAWEKQQLP